MGDFVEGEGKNPAPYVQQAMEVKRDSIKKEVIGFKNDFGESFTFSITINTCNDDLVCKNCREASKQKFKVNEFLENMPIPNKCENLRGCRCWVNADFE